MYDSILAFIQSTEEKLARMTEGSSDPEVAKGLKTPITPGDIAFLAEELWRGRSAVTGIPTRNVLIRWRKPEGKTMVRIGEDADEQKSSNVRLGDLVCMTKDEATRHEKMILRGDSKHEDLYDEAVIAKIEARLEEARSFEQHR
ncbi:tRNA threonylcarbamoyladenosine dehydratase 2 like protein [Verticillium longisporum]|nr:tRNA threonylcarbamoyladenosine dehydratase 2 like protein [Verticillium longisporum]